MISIINITKITTYVPMSKNTMKGKSRVDFINEMATKYDKDLDWFYKEFTRYMAIVIINRVKFAVQHQKIGKKSMKEAYKPLSEPYNSKKGKNKNKFWMNSGYLINNITTFRDGRGRWNIGYPKNIKHPAGDIEASNIMLYLEKGTKKGLPPRPLFTPILRMVAKNIDGYFWHWVKLMKFEY